MSRFRQGATARTSARAGRARAPCSPSRLALRTSAMARQGDTLENPVTGERLAFRRTTAESGGAVLSFAYFLPAGGSVSLAHVHPRQEERFEIVSGRARIRVGRRLLRASAGESVA